MIGGLDGKAYIFERDGTGIWSEVQILTASDGAASFGIGVAISGAYAIVGAPGDNTDATGGNPLSGAGSAYVFEKDGTGNWLEVEKIVASDRDAGARFGQSVSISGNYGAIGAPKEDYDATGGNPLTDAGSAYLFERDGSGNWIEAQKVVASDRNAGAEYGHSVSISGTYAIAGAYKDDTDDAGGNNMTEAGSAYLFERDGTGNWLEVKKAVASDRDVGNRFGFAVSVSGDKAMIGSYSDDKDAEGNSLNNAGSACFFERDGAGSWMEVQKVTASDRNSGDYFGYSVSIDNDYSIAGAQFAKGTNNTSEAGSSYIFELITCGTVNTGVTEDNNTLTADASGASYQWTDCDNGHSAISGETGQSFTATANGNYAVIVTESGCTDTSACYNIAGVGIENHNFNVSLQIYPNPVSHTLNVVIGEAAGTTNVQLYNMLGAKVREQNFANSKVELDMQGLPAGVYMLKVMNGGQQGTMRIAKR